MSSTIENFTSWDQLEDSSASNAPTTTPTTTPTTETEETDDTTFRPPGVLGYASQGLKGAAEFLFPGDDGIDVIDQVENFGKGIIPGAANFLDQTGAGTLAIAATDPNLKFLKANLPKKTEQKYRNKTREVLDLISEAEIFRPDIGEEDLFARKLGEGLGSTLPILVAAAKSRGKSLAPIVMGMLASGGEASDRAIAGGATEDQRSWATRLANLLGITEAAAPIKVANLFKKGFGDEAAEGIFESFKRIAETTGMEAAQEFVQGLGQNLIERGYNLDKELFGSELREMAEVGGGVGFIIATMAELMLPRNRRATSEQEKAQEGADEFYSDLQKEAEKAAKENPNQRQLQNQANKDTNAIIEERAEAEAKLVQQKKEADLAITEKNTADAERIKESGLTEEDLRASGLDKRNTEYKKLELLDYTNPSDRGNAIEIYKGLLNNPKTANNPEAVAKINSVISTLEQTQEELTTVKKGKSKKGESKKELKPTSDVVEVRPAGISDRMNTMYQRGLQEKTLTYADVDGSLPPGFDPGLQGDFYALLESKGITLVDVGDIKSASTGSKDASLKILEGRKEVAPKDAGFDSSLNDVMFKTFEDHYNQSINVAESNIGKGYITRNKINELINTVEGTTADQKLALAQEAVRYFTSKGIEIEAESTESRDAEKELKELNKTEAKRKEELLKAVPKENKTQSIGKEILGNKTLDNDLSFVTPEDAKRIEKRKENKIAFDKEAAKSSKNPLTKAVGQKTTVARLDNNGDVELLKGTTQDHPEFGRVLEIKDGSATSFVPLQQGVHIYKPTLTNLDTIGYRPKSEVKTTKGVTSSSAREKLGLKEQRRDGTETPEMQVLLEKLTAAEMERDSYNRQGEKVLPRVKRRVAAAQSAVAMQRKIEQETSPLEQRSGDLTSNTSLYEKGSSNVTAVDVVDVLVKEYGEGIKQGMDNGFINILNTAAEIPIYILEDSYNPKTGLPGISANTVAFINTRDNKVYIIADRLASVNEAPATLRHEVGVHYGLKKMLGEELYNRLVESLKANKDTDSDIKSAWEGVSKTYSDRKESDPIFIEEVFARIGDNSPQNPLWRRIVEAIKNFFRNLGYGWNVDNISAKEIQEMIRYSTKEAIKNSPVAGEATTSSTDILDISEARKKDLEGELKRGEKLVKKEKRKKPFKVLSEEQLKELRRAYPNLTASLTDYAINKMLESDFALQNRIHYAAERRYPDPKPESMDTDYYEPVADAIFAFSAFQTLHFRSLVDLYNLNGNLQWVPEASMYVSDPDLGSPSIAGLFTLAEQYAAKAGITEQEAQRYGHLSLVARRMNEIKKNNAAAKKANLDYKEAARKTSDIKERNQFIAAAKRELKKIKIQHLTDEALIEGLSLYNAKGELGEFVRTTTIQWESIHADVIKHLVDSQLMSKEQAEQYMDATGYVPAQREGYNTSDAWARGLEIVKTSSSRKFNGSYKNINNIYENIKIWVDQSIGNAVINRNKINKINQTYKYAPEIIKNVDNATDGRSTQQRLGIVSVHMNFNGQVKKHYFQFTDPIFAAAFGGLDTILLPGYAVASRLTNASRNAIVLNPVFSITQIWTQDMVTAMFTSGVSNPWAIPLLVLKELGATLLGVSETHKYLKNRGIVGFKGSTLLGDLTIEKRGEKESEAINKVIEKIKDGFKFFGGEKFYDLLQAFAMISDNAVRQAVFLGRVRDESLKIEKRKDLSKEERQRLLARMYRDATMAAANHMHFMPKGSSAGMRAILPVGKFLNAGLRGVKVQGDVLSFRGITPRPKKQNRAAFYNALFQVAWTTIIYTLMKADDDEYNELDPSQRDFKIHYGKGITSPLRKESFTVLGKIIPEHMVNMMINKNQDMRKFAIAMGRALVTISSQNIMPDILKLYMEQKFNQTMGPLNYQISPDSLKDQESRNQFTASTLELSKKLGIASGYNPMMIQKFLDSVSSSIFIAVSLIAEPFIAPEGRPKLTVIEQLRRWPGFKQFLIDPQGNTRNTNDMFELLDLTNTWAKTISFDEKNRPDGEAQKEYRRRYGPGIEANKEANRLRKAIAKSYAEDKITLLSNMTAVEKREALDASVLIRKAILDKVTELNMATNDALFWTDTDPSAPGN